MKSKRERMADMFEKAAIVFVAAAFLQSDHGGEGVFYFVIGVVAAGISVRLSGPPDRPR